MNIDKIFEAASIKDRDYKKITNIIRFTFNYNNFKFIVSKKIKFRVSKKFIAGKVENPIPLYNIFILSNEKVYYFNDDGYFQTFNPYFSNNYKEFKNLLDAFDLVEHFIKTDQFVIEQ